jgi:hypothetical protein
MNNFLEGHKNQSVLSVYAPIVFIFFCCFVMEKIKIRFWLASMKKHTNSENPSSNLLQIACCGIQEAA